MGNLWIFCVVMVKEDMCFFVANGKQQKNKDFKNSTPSQVLLEGSGQQFWLLDGGAPTASRSAPVYHSKARQI